MTPSSPTHIDLAVLIPARHTPGPRNRSQLKTSEPEKMVQIGQARILRQAWPLACLVAVAWGCSNQDADRLARVGRKAAIRSGVLSGNPDDKLTPGWQAVRVSWDDATADARVASSSYVGTGTWRAWPFK